MRSVWIALTAILAVSGAGAVLLWRALDETNGSKPSLAPRGARVLVDRRLGTDPPQRVLTWRLGGYAEEPSSGLYGVTIVEGNRRLYSHRARQGAERVSVETGDFSGDGRADVLVFDDLDGSGACGAYRALVTASGSVRQVQTRLLCEDQGSIHVRRGGLLVSLGEKKDPKTRDQIHCCYLFVRKTLVRWSGTSWVHVSSRVSRLPAMHTYPGGHAPGGPA
jgi:hypothetical protein